MSRLGHTRDKIYKTVARQLHGVVPCWVCGEHVAPEAATLEHIRPLSEGGNSHAENLAISHEVCNGQRHATGRVPTSATSPGQVLRRKATDPLAGPPSSEALLPPAAP
ncbi:HNH endonuclease [Polaromonas jejuensis]|uniref:HNH endonuclease n=1 Tax=Polaromonas jejuensis TaxID=457502 RepID=A0ABW0Q5X8_9BURK|nr:HNH endonuclease signature motif containing protein [Polaromonas jejuensis]